MFCGRDAARAAVATLMMLALGGGNAAAQYFGMNKVRYETFDFKVAATEHFDIYHYPAEKAAVDEAARMAERWYARLSTILGHRLPNKQPLILYAAHPHFRQTNAIPGFLGESTGGVTEAFKRRIVLPFAGPLAGTDHVLGHELVHAFQYDLGGRLGRGISQLPLWFIEGMAEYLSVGPLDPVTAMWMRDAVAREDLPDIEDLNSPEYFPYRYGHALWSYLAGRWGDEVVGTILRAAIQERNAIGGIETVTGVDVETLSQDWHRALSRAYAPVLEVIGRGDTGSRRAILTSENSGELNVAPSLSPDGRHVAFLSERDLFSIDLFLADTETGRIVRKLVATATDPHLDSLQFMHSAGAWSPSGRRLALAAISKGQPVLLILDAERGETEAEIALPSLGEVFAPTWAPDERALAFSAMDGGVTDLFVYRLETAALERLTSDLHADLQPAWSPDGRRLAFVTDRFSNRLSTLAFGHYELALIDVASREVRRLPLFDTGKHINPQWSPDGRSIYFVSDRTGIPNVYRADAGGGAAEQLTNLTTGVAGITALSPALSVAGRTGELAFSVFEDGGYRVELMADAGRAARAPIGEPAYRAAALLPPERAASDVAAAIGSPAAGLPDAPVRGVEDYRPGLSLDYVGQPTLVAGSDPFGTFVGGGTSLLFSDMLGDHTVAAQVQVNGGFRDIGGQIGYVNRSSRWLWGAVLEQIPYVSGFAAEAVQTIDGEPALVRQIERFRQTDRQLSGLLAYPFSRAARVEFSAGMRQIAFDREVDVIAASLATGRILRDEQRDLAGPDSLTLGQSSVALVYDASVFGLMSPLTGRRARFEVSPTFGSLNFSEVLADYREYWMPARPFTLAVRGLHFGRYGADAQDPRLSPLFLGYSNLVRGYEFDSFSAADCTPSAQGGCSEIERLIGSRLAVGNVELRFPLVGAFNGEIDYGGLPIEGLVFADAGIAWSGGDPRLSGVDRRVVSSAGVGLRAALGFVIVEVDAVRPFDRPGKGWVFQFGFRPGF